MLGDFLSEVVGPPNERQPPSRGAAESRRSLLRESGWEQSGKGGTPAPLISDLQAKAGDACERNEGSEMHFRLDSEEASWVAGTALGRR